MQYSLKSDMLRKCRFGVSYHSWGSEGVTGTFPLKNIWNLAGVIYKVWETDNYLFSNPQGFF